MIIPAKNAYYLGFRHSGWIKKKSPNKEMGDLNSKYDICIT